MISIDLHQIAKKAKEAALKAGEIVMHYFQKDLEVMKKQGVENPAFEAFTIADRKSQDAILDHLQPCTEKYDFGILAEEDLDDQSRFKKDYFWCIDPLDGTLPFTEKKEGFSVSIALVTKEGETVIGVIYNPINKELYHAIKGHGAYKNNKVFDVQPNNFNTLVYDRSFLKTTYYDQVLSLLQPEKEYKFGGACMNAIWVLENAPALYIKPPKKKLGNGSIWDYASTSLLFSELGYQASSFNGLALPLNQKNTFMNECGILYSTLPNTKEIVDGIEL
ncbi:inositol monophosphatase family protein [Flammeovirga yaeyamensis]|uniref:Inositol monophosphatase family protein n=1 Tax=Flammeovirga yaeyamensis TaxID=367791 RepID=A0AAX1NAJ9_9BACT|nr:inositol monophosphatase family protein [Flammeovirga yaeyamensis]MBB3699353.1 fructose-1,6-bisphosphatase/inositol monophosphatase family enzyme [Flammeovirga yaeyamensis]NMF35387.1 inositol monophosphatase family protein [Flammeovirga yaeyamensis]QWG04247.1 inositol monophosphatase family protein [Flammeovirga yaeyamensis]